VRKDESNLARFWQAYGDKTSFLREKKWRWVVGVLGLLLLLWSAYSGVKHHNRLDAAKAAAGEQTNQEFKYLKD
jgi:hypothetical protein